METNRHITHIGFYIGFNFKSQIFPVFQNRNQDNQ